MFVRDGQVVFAQSVSNDQNRAVLGEVTVSALAFCLPGLSELEAQASLQRFFALRRGGVPAASHTSRCISTNG